MHVRQMKEGSEQHLVIKPQPKNSMNQVQKNLKVSQNGKGPPPQEPQNPKLHINNSPPAKNRGRRRSRGGRKSDQSDISMRPSSRPCNLVDNRGWERVKFSVARENRGWERVLARENRGWERLERIVDGKEFWLERIVDGKQETYPVSFYWGRLNKLKF